MNFFIANLKWEAFFFQSTAYFSCDRQPQVDDNGQERIGFMEQFFWNGVHIEIFYLEVNWLHRQSRKNIFFVYPKPVFPNFQTCGNLQKWNAICCTSWRTHNKLLQGLMTFWKRIFNDILKNVSTFWNPSVLWMTLWGAGCEPLP